MHSSDIADSNTCALLSGEWDTTIWSMVDKSLLALDFTQVKKAVWKQLMPGNDEHLLWLTLNSVCGLQAPKVGLQDPTLISSSKLRPIWTRT